MKPAADDRRVRKTKIAIKDALVELMQKQHISGISIRAICEAADINRSILLRSLQGSIRFAFPNRRRIDGKAETSLGRAGLFRQPPY